MSFRAHNLNRLVQQGIRTAIPMDPDGYFGRECPNTPCLGVFKIRPGTGLEGENLPCYCPYCGHKASHDQFYTQEQVKYLESVALQQVQSAFLKDLKTLGTSFKPRPRGFGLSFSINVKPGARLPLHQIREPELETPVTCNSCGLDYVVFGLFAFCPDCGLHNSLQILIRNLDLTRKQLALADTLSDPDLRTHLVEDALENCVSAFDGFGREVARINASKSTDPDKCESLSFQNLDRAADALAKLFGLDLRTRLSASEWSELRTGFMRRHLLAHRSGVIDQKHIDATGEPQALLGRRLTLARPDVEAVLALVEKLGEELERSM